MSPGDRTRRTRHWRRAAGVVLGLMAIGIAFWLTRARGSFAGDRHKPGARAREVTAPAVEVVRPTRGGIQRTIQQPASIHSFESVDLYAMVSGYLKTQEVDIGSRIKKGEVLAEINVPRDAKAVEEAASLVGAGAGTARPGRGPDQGGRGAARGRGGRGKAGRIGRRPPKAARRAGREAVRPRQRAGGARAVDQQLVDEQQLDLDAARPPSGPPGLPSRRPRRAPGRRGRDRPGQGRRGRGQGLAGSRRGAAGTA